jgi:DNA-binding FrmR family transcriptional regulator
LSEHRHAIRPSTVKRVQRAKRHLHSVVAMVQGGKHGLDIAQQLHAVEKVVAQAKRTRAHDHLDHCLEETIGPLSLEKRGSVHEFREIAKYL